MFKRNDELKSLEQFSRFRKALETAVTPEKTVEQEQVESFSYDTLPDDHQLGFTDSMMMHAGIGISHAGEILGIEAPVSLDQLHRRGEVFLYASLGATALFAAAEASQQLL